jgi:hypothetical protein
VRWAAIATNILELNYQSMVEKAYGSRRRNEVVEICSGQWKEKEICSNLGNEAKRYGIEMKYGTSDT